MCQGFSHFPAICPPLMLIKFATTSSEKVKDIFCCELYLAICVKAVYPSEQDVNMKLAPGRCSKTETHSAKKYLTNLAISL